MPYKINLTAHAEQDLHEIRRYITDILEAPYSAKRIITLIRKSMGILTVFPETRALAPEEELAQAGVRVIHAHKYRIYYGVDHGQRVTHIYAILHHLQDTQKNFED